MTAYGDTALPSTGVVIHSTRVYRIPSTRITVYRSFAMEVILLENIDKLGSRGQMVKVADGYGRNFLLPKKLAVAATTQNRKWVEQQRVRFLKLEAKEKADAADLSTLLEGVSVTVIRKAGERAIFWLRHLDGHCGKAPRPRATTSTSARSPRHAHQGAGRVYVSRSNSTAK